MPTGTGSGGQPPRGLQEGGHGGLEPAFLLSAADTRESHVEPLALVFVGFWGCWLPSPRIVWYKAEGKPPRGRSLAGVKVGGRDAAPLSPGGGQRLLCPAWASIPTFLQRFPSI